VKAVYALCVAPKLHVAVSSIYKFIDRFEIGVCNKTDLLAVIAINS